MSHDTSHVTCGGLTGEAHGAHVADVNESPVTEAGGAVVHLGLGRQVQLASEGRVGQEDPLEQRSRCNRGHVVTENTL